MSLSNTQYDAIMREYSRRQLRAAREQQTRRAEVYERIPQMAELDSHAGALGVRCARSLLEEGKDQTADFRASMERTAQMRRALLESHGYPADYLEIQYTCPDCMDTGYTDAGRCHCFRQAVVDLYYTQSGLRKVLQRENFDTFSLSYYPETIVHPATGKTARENMENILQTCHAFVDDFDAKGGNLLFYGPTGLGKTFLSHCIAAELMQQAHSVIYYSASQLFRALEADTFGRQDPQAGDPDIIFGCDLLIIDDLGTEMTNQFVASALFRLLNERIGSGRSTIISTNLSLSALSDTYSERIMSRIGSSFTLLGFFGNDIRIARKLGNHPG